MSELFDRDIKTIGKHINNALKEEVDANSTVTKFATVQKEGDREVTRDIEYYNLDVIISVDYKYNISGVNNYDCRIQSGRKGNHG